MPVHLACVNQLLSASQGSGGRMAQRPPMAQSNPKCKTVVRHERATIGCRINGFSARQCDNNSVTTVRNSRYEELVSMAAKAFFDGEKWEVWGMGNGDDGSHFATAVPQILEACRYDGANLFPCCSQQVSSAPLRRDLWVAAANSDVELFREWAPRDFPMSPACVFINQRFLFKMRPPCIWIYRCLWSWIIGHRRQVYQREEWGEDFL